MWPFEISFLLQKMPMGSIRLIACLNNLFLCWAEFLSDRCMVFLHVSHCKSRCWRGHAAFVVSEGIVPCFFQLLVFSGIPWLQSLPPCSHGLLLCVSLCLMRTLVFGFRVRQGNPGWSDFKTINYICKDCFST